MFADVHNEYSHRCHLVAHRIWTARGPNSGMIAGQVTGGAQEVALEIKLTRILTICARVITMLRAEFTTFRRRSSDPLLRQFRGFNRFMRLHVKSSPPPIPPGVPTDDGLDLRGVVRHVISFRGSDNLRGVMELAVTAAPLAFLWLLMWLSLNLHYLLTLALSVPTAGFLLRLFLIQHDCGHGAFFTTRRANDWLGRCIGVFTLSPYDFWRHTHALHHASTGNLDRRGIGDVDTLTVDEFSKLNRTGRTRYWLYRHPLIMFGLGPAYLFLLRYRLPLGLMRHGWRPWISTLATNAAIAAVVGGAIFALGLRPFLLVQAPITLLAASAGVWLFYVQHQFESTVWKNGEDWEFREAALYGSSNYVLPPLLRWFTANIGAHHVHHLCSMVPFYRLHKVLQGWPALANVNRLTVARSLKSVRLVLWDEDERQLISFRAARAKIAANAATSRATSVGCTVAA